MEITPESAYMYKQQVREQQTDMLLLKKTQDAAKQAGEAIISLIQESTIDFRA
ncbi:MAG: hypothetical protein HY606_06995 [Planctomycetes bacterium]|nr:hypothetical protein [Planctomycetota bacterium]